MEMQWRYYFCSGNPILGDQVPLGGSPMEGRGGMEACAAASGEQRFAHSPAPHSKMEHLWILGVVVAGVAQGAGALIIAPDPGDSVGSTTVEWSMRTNTTSDQQKCI